MLFFFGSEEIFFSLSYLYIFLFRKSLREWSLIRFLTLKNILQDGKLKQYQKSEPIPEVNNEPVKVVVADSLEDMVFKSGKNGMYKGSRYYFLVF